MISYSLNLSTLIVFIKISLKQLNQLENEATSCPGLGPAGKGFTDSFSLKMESQSKSQTVDYFLSGSENIYWILDLEDAMHSI